MLPLHADGAAQDGPKLSKAQKKNLRRAEKRKEKAATTAKA